MSTRKPYAVTLGPWLTANLGRHWAGGLTGQDWPALRAAVQLVELWVSCDGEHRKPVALAYAACVNAMQPNLRYLAFHAVAHVADWGHRWQLWRQAGLNTDCLKGVPECKYGPLKLPKTDGAENLHKLEQALSAVVARDAGGAS